MEVNAKVRVELPTVTFLGRLTEVRGQEAIVRINPEYMDKIQPLRNDTYDPQDCLVVHIKFITEWINP